MKISTSTMSVHPEILRHTSSARSCALEPPARVNLQWPPTVEHVPHEAESLFRLRKYAEVFGRAPGSYVVFTLCC